MTGAHGATVGPGAIKLTPGTEVMGVLSGVIPGSWGYI